MITPREEYEYWVNESKKTSVQYERYDYCRIQSLDAKSRFMKETDERLKKIGQRLDYLEVKVDMAHSGLISHTHGRMGYTHTHEIEHTVKPREKD